MRNTVGDAFADTLACAGGACRCFRHRLILDLFLQSCGRTTRSLTGTGVRTRALTMNGQPTAVTHSPICSQIDQTFDRELNFTTKIAFYHQRAHILTNTLELLIGRSEERRVGKEASERNTAE